MSVDTTALAEDLRHFNGSDEFYRHWTGRLVYTQGVQYLAEKAGAYWLLDVIASHQPTVLRKVAQAGDRDFQVWELTVNPDKSARVICHNGQSGNDGDREIYKKQRIEFTDFPLPDFKLYVADGVILLPSEY